MVSRVSTGEVGSGEGHCDKWDSRMYPGGSGRNSGEERGFGLGGREDEVHWERVEGI